MPTIEDFENEAIVRVKQHEGYRPELYRDPLNHTILTSGYGHNFNEPISLKLAGVILEYDWDIAKNEVKKIFTYEAINRLSYKKYFVLVELMFQLGFKRFSGFTNMIVAIEKGNTKLAAQEIRDSEYYKQVTSRAETLAKILEQNS